jgi:hypothetical protein
MTMFRAGLAVVLALGLASAAHAQFGRGFRGGRVATDADFDGRFHYCRMLYRPAMNGYGGSWRTDYPNADINLSVRLSELTKISVSKTGASPNILLVRPGGDELFQCPLVIMSAPGSAVFDETETANLREYLLKGGILWTDDSWGSYQWAHWVGQIQKVLPPAQYPMFDVPLEHTIYRTQFEVKEIPQIPNIGFFLRSGGGTSEQGADSAVAQVKGIADAGGRLMVLMTHNTDIADSWEREGDDPSYFYAFSPRGYAFGINAVIYAHTH